MRNIAQQAVVEIFKRDGYRKIDNHDGEILLHRKHQKGDRSVILVYSNGKYDVINFKKGT